MSVTATKTRTTGVEAAGAGFGEEAPSRTLAVEQMTRFRYFHFQNVSLAKPIVSKLSSLHKYKL